MNQTNIKIQKINALIHKNIFDILLKKINNKQYILTITKVKTFSNLSYCHIYIMTHNNNKLIIDKLNNIANNISYDLLKKIKLKRQIKLRFIYDSELINLININNKIDEF